MPTFKGQARPIAWFTAEFVVTYALLWVAFQRLTQASSFNSSLFTTWPSVSGLLWPLLGFFLGIVLAFLWEVRLLWRTLPWRQPLGWEKLNQLGAARPFLHFRLRSSGKNPSPNAYLVTAGHHSIVICDAELLIQHPPDEIQAIVFHELGHAVLGHGKTNFLCLAALWGMAGLLALSVLAYPNAIFPGLSPALSAAIFCLLASLIMRQAALLSRPLRRYWAWKREYSADQWAIQALGERESLQAALGRTASRERTQPQIPALAFWMPLLYGHPPPRKRLATLEIPSKSEINAKKA